MSSADGFIEKLPGMKESGDISVTAVYTKAGYDKILDNVGTSEAWTITFPDSSTFVVTGFISEPAFSDPHDGLMTTSFTIVPTGKPVFTPGT